MLLEQVPHTDEQPSSFRIVPTDGWCSLPSRHSLILSSVMILQEQTIIFPPLPIYYSRLSGDVKMPINSWTINLILGIVMAIIAGGGIYIWKNSIEEAAIAQAKVESLQKELVLQEKVISDLTELNKESNKLIAEMKDKTVFLNDKLKGLDVYLDTHKEEKESSEVLKRTIRELSQ